MMKRCYDRKNERKRKNGLYEGLINRRFEGEKVGVLFSIDRQDDNRKEVAQKIRKDLQDAGAILTDDIQLNAEGVDNLQTLEYEFKHNVNDFLSKQKMYR